jgi:hypothetical protein
MTRKTSPPHVDPVREARLEAFLDERYQRWGRYIMCFLSGALVSLFVTIVWLMSQRDWK